MARIRYDVVETYPIVTSATIGAGDFVKLTSGSVEKDTTDLSTGIIGQAPHAATDNSSTTGLTDYVTVVRKGRISGTGMVEGAGGTYTDEIAVGDFVAVFNDGSTQYLVKSSSGRVGRVVSGSITASGGAADSTGAIEVDFNTEHETVTTSEFEFPLTAPTTGKMQFRDTGLFIHSPTDGKLLISSDGTGADDITLTGNVTITNDLLVSGSFSGISAGSTYTGTVQINDNSALQFEGVADDADGFTLSCDASGDATISSTAGKLDVSTKDGVVYFVDTDAASDYIELITVAGSSRQVITAEPSGLFRFKDAGDGDNSDVLDLDLTDAGGANKMTSAVAFEVETTAGNILLDSAGDISLDPAGADVHLLGAGAGKLTMASTSVSLFGGDTGGDDLILYANSSDADPSLSLLGGAGFEALILDQEFKFLYDASNYASVGVSVAGYVTLAAVGTGASLELTSGTAGNIILDSTADIILEAGGGDITADAQVTITNTSADQFLVRYDGSNLFGVDVDDDGSTTLTATGTNADFEIASGTAGDITLDATADIILEAAGGDITMDAGVAITIANTVNKVGLTVTQNDTTNNPIAFSIVNTGTGADFGTDSLELTNGIIVPETGVAMEIQKADNSGNVVCFTLDNNDSTNNPTTLLIENAGTGADIETEALTLTNGLFAPATGVAMEINVANTFNVACLILDQDDSTNNNPALVIENAGSGNDITFPSGSSIVGGVWTGGCTLGANQDLVGSSTSDITINTDKFTVAGATGNTVIAGTLTQNGASTFSAGVTVGVDGTGYDVKLFGDTASRFMVWDQTANDLILADAVALQLGGDESTADGFKIEFDGTDTLAIDALTANDKVIVGGTTSTDFVLTSAGGTVTLDADANTLAITAIATSITTSLTVGTTLGVTGAQTNTAGIQCAAVARTATADGLTTGIVADGTTYVEVTSASANNIIVLPTPTPGNIVWLYNAANGYELRSDTPASVAINGGTGASAESAVAAGALVRCVCTSATTWVATEFTAAGVESAVEVAA